MPSIAPIIRATKLACRQEIERVGFRHRREGILTMELTEDVIGWVGLNTQSYRGDGAFGVNPNVAVRHQTLHRIEAELRGEKYHAYIPPTVLTNLWHVMDPKPATWIWEIWSVEEAPAKAREIAEAISEFGIQWMTERQSLEAMEREMLRQGYGKGTDFASTLICAWLLLDRREEALDLAEHWEQWTRQQERPDITAYVEFREFAARLRQYVKNQPSTA